MFNFKYEEQPVQEVKITKNPILEEGLGTFYVQESRPHTSKSGNECLKITMRLYDKHGTECWYSMYVMPNNPLRLKFLCASIGKSYLYNANGVIDPDQLVGERGQCMIKTEISTNPEYANRSIIQSFVPLSSRGDYSSIDVKNARAVEVQDPRAIKALKAAEAAEAAAEDYDDLPF